MRAPDVSWVRRERLDVLTSEQWEEFLPLCPDFVLELRSRSDSLRLVKDKMDEYIENGARLGWLLDPKNRKVHVYIPGRCPKIHDDPPEISGEPVLNGFRLNLRKVWAAMTRERRE